MSGWGADMGKPDILSENGGGAGVLWEDGFGWGAVPE